DTLPAIQYNSELLDRQTRLNPPRPLKEERSMTTEQDTVQAHPKVPTDLKPGRVFVTLDEEIDNLQAEVQRFRTDEEALEGEFTPFRLRMGVYGQRQMDQQMIRVKLPYGGVNAEQMDTCAIVAEKYSGYRRGHITTRENFQFHFVPLDQ